MVDLPRINIGNVPGDRKGDPLRVMAQKHNQMATQVEQEFADLPSIPDIEALEAVIPTVANQEIDRRLATEATPDTDAESLVTPEDAVRRVMGNGKDATWTQNFTGARTRTLQDKARENVSGGDSSQSTLLARLEEASAGAVELGRRRLANLESGSVTKPADGSALYKLVTVDESATGLRGYRLPLFRNGRRNAAPRADSFDASKHLRNFLANPNPVVVFVGDSLMTNLVINGLNEQARKIQVALQRAYPEKNITFYNRAISGMRQAQLGIAITSVNQVTYPWYTDVNREWWKYIADLNPDLLFDSFGMNDGSYFATNNDLQWTGYSENAFLGLEGQNKKMDIVLLTNLLPTIAYSGATSLTKAQQEGRDAAAGLMRSLAAERGYGLIDVNHWVNQARDSTDILSCEYVREVNAASVAFPWTGANECRSLNDVAAFNNIGSTIFRVQALRMAVSPQDVIQISDVGGFLQLEFYLKSWSIYTVRTGIATPAIGGNVVVGLLVDGQRIVVTIDGATVFDACPLKAGGLFTPYIGYATTDPGDNFTLTHHYGRDTLVNAVFADPDLYNTSGGNQLNHPGPAGIDMIFDPVFEATNFAAPFVPRPPGARALAMLPWHSGLAIDFERDEYVIRSNANHALDATGKPSDIISFASGGPYARYYDPTTGEPVGYRISGTTLPQIVGTTFGFAATEGTLIVEAKVEDDDTTSYIAGLSKSSTFSDRIVMLSNVVSGSRCGSCQWASSSPSANGSASHLKRVPAIFHRYAFAYRSSDSWIEFTLNGQRAYKPTVTSFPVGMDRIKLGHEGGSVAVPTIFKRLIWIPKALGGVQIQRATWR